MKPKTELLERMLNNDTTLTEAEYDQAFDDYLDWHNSFTEQDKLDCWKKMEEGIPISNLISEEELSSAESPIDALNAKLRSVIKSDTFVGFWKGKGNVLYGVIT